MTSTFTNIAFVFTILYAHAALADDEPSNLSQFADTWCFDPADSDNSSEGYLSSDFAALKGNSCQKLFLINSDNTFVYKNNYCTATVIKVTSDTAPSGTDYQADVVAKCADDSSGVRLNKTRKFHFNHYKLHLEIEYK